MNKINILKFYAQYGNCVVFTKREDMQKFLDVSHKLGKFWYIPDTNFKTYCCELDGTDRFTSIYTEGMCLTSDEQYSMQDFYAGKNFNIYKFSQIDLNITKIESDLYRGLNTLLEDSNELQSVIKYLVNNYEIRRK